MTPDHNDYPTDDAATLALLNSAHADGIMILNDNLVLEMVHRVGISRFTELVTVTALCQPGTRAFLPDYIERRERGSAESCIHPLLDEITAETWGMPIFREHIEKAIQIVAGFSGDRAVRMRKSADRLQTPESERERGAFRVGAQLRHPELSQNTIEQILNKLIEYAPYAYPQTVAKRMACEIYAAAFRYTNGHEEG
jgi:DNA polymerase-3 subunit alpha